MTSPGAQTAGRRPRWSWRRHSTFAPATRRRKLRADPVNPAARAAGNNRFAEIRPFDDLTFAATRSATDA